MAEERFICINCHNIDRLSREFRCSKCGSDSVVSIELLPKVASSSKTSTRDATRPVVRLYEVIYGPFRCTLVAESEEQAILRAINEGQWYVEHPEMLQDSTGVYTAAAKLFERTSRSVSLIEEVVVDDSDGNL